MFRIWGKSEAAEELLRSSAAAPHQHLSSPSNAAQKVYHAFLRQTSSWDMCPSGWLASELLRSSSGASQLISSSSAVPQQLRRSSSAAPQQLLSSPSNAAQKLYHAFLRQTSSWDMCPSGWLASGYNTYTQADKYLGHVSLWLACIRT